MRRALALSSFFFFLLFFLLGIWDGTDVLQVCYSSCACPVTDPRLMASLNQVIPPYSLAIPWPILPGSSLQDPSLKYIQGASDV